jgi:hypothetical protein
LTDALQIAQRSLHVGRDILEPRRARDLLVRRLRDRLLLVPKQIATGLGGECRLRTEQARSDLLLLLRLLRLRLAKQRRRALSGLTRRLSAEERC